MSNRLKAILFDLGSTLLEYEKFDWDEIARMGMVSGYEFLKSEKKKIPPIEVCGARFHEIYDQWRLEREESLYEINFKDLVSHAFKQLDIPNYDEFVLEFIHAYYQPISEHVEDLNDSAVTLQKLKSTGLRLVIVSNSVFPAYLHMQELNKYNILPHIDGMIFSCELGIKKPHPDIYQFALQIAGCNADEAFFVGDRYLEDVKGPSEAGIKAILKRKPGREYPPEITNFTIIDELSELLDLIPIDS
jgi:HAD superfamily hydrolase (TIGR01549 family)